MPILISEECPGCRRFFQTGDFFHEKEEWDTYHNGGRTNGKSDWQPREELKKELERMKQVWKRGKEYEKRALENYIKEHGHAPNEIPEWKMKKILSKKGVQDEKSDR